MLAAVIGIGSNSVRALVARNNEGVFERLYRDREGTRLFAGLDSRGVLKEESILKTAEAVRRMSRPHSLPCRGVVYVSILRPHQFRHPS